MTVKQLIELLQKQDPTKEVLISQSGACTTMQKENIIDMPWGIIFR